jgi:hypothetical protein
MRHICKGGHSCWGDAARLFKEILRKTTLRLALRYAHRDRLKEWYYDPFELDWVEQNEETIIKDLTEELKDPSNYRLKAAYAYFTPKTELCFRRMIYIPFKDLVVRYAFATVIADFVDQDLSLKCFANRRDHDPDSGLFLEDYARVSWPGFCEWQRKNSEQEKFSTLLRTDISAFYDAISHQYLIKEIAASLAVDEASKLIEFFSRLLQVPVVSYSHVDGNQRVPETIHQGLCIGNGTEGFLANIYLRHIDGEMAKVLGIDFGRYNDDMRIFALDRATAKRAMLALQERLLTKGLNLNSSKTEFAEGRIQIEGLRSRAYEGEEYSEDDEDAIVTRPTVTDIPFDEFDRDFKIGQKLEKKGKDAKDFSHFLAKRITLSERLPGHVEMLHGILTEWHGSAKHAAWRLVESFARSECPKETRELAEQVLLECLSNSNVTNFAKYRLLHHLVRPRRVGGRYCEGLQKSSIRKLKSVLPSFLGEMAFELNIIALYTMRCFGASIADLEGSVEQHARKPVPLPIKNALTLASRPKKPRQLPAFVPISDEEAEIEDNY